EGEVGEEIERVVLRVGLHGHAVAVRRAPAQRRVEAGPLRAAALAVVDGAEAVEQAGAHRALGDLAGAAPAAAQMRDPDRGAEALGQARRGLREGVEPLI